MIDGKNFRIYETQDVVDACNNIEEAAVSIAACLRKWNHEGMGDQDARDFMGNMFTVLTAAGVGAAACMHQGGIVLMKEGCSEQDRAAAVAALDELREKQRKAAADAKAAPETIPQ